FMEPFCQLMWILAERTDIDEWCPELLHLLERNRICPIPYRRIVPVGFPAVIVTVVRYIAEIGYAGEGLVWHRGDCMVVRHRTLRVTDDIPDQLIFRSIH